MNVYKNSSTSILVSILAITLMSLIGVFYTSTDTDIIKLISLDNSKAIKTSIDISTESSNTNTIGTVTPNGGNSNFGKDINWGKPIKVPQSPYKPNKYTITNYRRRAVKYMNYNDSYAKQVRIAKKLDFSSGKPKHLKESEIINGVSTYYLEYNGEKYYTVAVGKPLADAMNIPFHELNGRLLKISLGDGSTVGGLVVDTKKMGDTATTNGWGQPYGNEMCTFEFYINVDNNIIPISKESSIGDLPTTYPNISPIKAKVPILSFQVSDIDILNLNLEGGSKND